MVQEKKVTDDCIIETGQEEQDVETSGDQENNRTFLIQDPIAEVKTCTCTCTEYTC